MTTNTARLNTRQAAEYLGIPEATLRWFRHKGDRGPRSYALTKRHVVYDLADLQSWAEAQKAATSKGGCL
ncbi:MAG: helix-turn-helix domain-containing protein [Mycobacterium sp.]|nr:helix-turn-helix domain-containing protein [Mycobacterium sp.]